MDKTHSVYQDHGLIESNELAEPATAALQCNKKAYLASVLYLAPFQQYLQRAGFNNLMRCNSWTQQVYPSCVQHVLSDCALALAPGLHAQC